MVRKPWVVVVLRVLATIGLLVLLIAAMDVSAMLGVLRRTDFVLLLLAFAAVLLTRLLSAIRWHLLLRHYGFELKFVKTIWVTLVSSSMTVILPGGVGGDVVRGYMVGAGSGNVAGVVSTIVVDRVIGLASMLALAMLGAAIFWWQGKPSSEGLLLFTVGLNAVFFAVLALSSLIDRITTLPGREFPAWVDKIRAVLSEQLLTLRLVTQRTSLLGVLFSSSVLVQLIRCISYYFIFAALGAETGIIQCLIAIPLVFVMQLAPVSVGGFGVREAGLVYFFGLYGVAGEASFAAGIIYHALVVVLSLIVVPIWLLQRRRRTAVANVD